MSANAASYRRTGRRAFAVGRVIEAFPAQVSWRDGAWRDGYMRELRAYVSQCGHEGLLERGPYCIIPTRNDKAE